MAFDRDFVNISAIEALDVEEDFQPVGWFSRRLLL